MDSSNREQGKNRHIRTAKLMNSRFQSIAVPRISARICSLITVMVDSLVAARFIAPEALAAITLLSSVFVFMSFFHDIFVSGVTTVIVRKKSLGLNREADRALGSFTLVTLLVFGSMSAVLMIFGREILGLFTDDAALVEQALKYYYPSMIAAPINETLLCLERGFQTDGRPGFFAFRGVITNILNIILDITVVVLFQAGIFGLAVASIVSTWVGYGCTMSHLFSDKCTIKPDFSVIRKSKEMCSYIREAMGVGMVYAIDDGLDIAVSATLNKSILSAGGVPAFTVFSVFLVIKNLFDSVKVVFQTVVLDLCTVQYTEEDREGFRLVFWRGLRDVLFIGILFAAGLELFPRQLAAVYHVSWQSSGDMFAGCVRLCALALPFTGVISVFSALMIASKHNKTAGMMVTISNVMMLVGLFMGNRLYGLNGIWIAYFMIPAIVALAETVLVRRAGILRADDRKAVVGSFSAELDDRSMLEISRQVYDFLNENEAVSTFAAKISLLLEESYVLIRNQNKELGRPVHIDIKLCIEGAKLIIVLYDDGLPFDPVGQMSDPDNPELIHLSGKVLTGLAPDSEYRRIMELNSTRLVIR